MSTPEELQAQLRSKESKDDILQWTLSMLQAKAGMDQAVGNFAVVTDKEIATKQPIRAWIDPRDAPTFGWNMSERPRQSITQNIMAGNTGQQDTASEQQPDRPVSPPPLAGGGDQVSSQPTKVSSLMKNIIGGLLIAMAAGGGTGAYLNSKGNMENLTAAQEIQALQQQQLINKMQEVQMALKGSTSGSQPSSLETMQIEICEELDSDPAFRDEIAADLQAIGQKILEHKRKRLSSNASTSKESESK